MSDTQTTPADATVNQNISDAVQTIVINTQEVPISEAPKVLKEMESSLMSDYTKKTMAVKQERERIAAQLQADKDWLDSHDPRLYGLYMPLVNGGAGFVGTEAQLHQYDNASEPEIEPEPRRPVKAFEGDPMFAAMQKRIADLEAKQNKIEAETFEAGTERVKTMTEAALKSFPNASQRMVNNELFLFLTQNGRHPQKNEIEAIVKTNHEDVSKIIARENKGKEILGKAPEKPVTATPAATQTPPKDDSGRKVLRLTHEPEKIATRILQRLSGSG